MITISIARDAALNILYTRGTPWLLHVVKIFKYSDPTNLAKHLEDIDVGLKKLQNIRLATGKRIREVDFANLFVQQIGGLEGIEDVIRSDLRAYHSLPVRLSDEQVFHAVLHLYKNICKKTGCRIFQVTCI